MALHKRTGVLLYLFIVSFPKESSDLIVVRAESYTTVMYSRDVLLLSGSAELKTATNSSNSCKQALWVLKWERRVQLLFWSAHRLQWSLFISLISVWISKEVRPDYSPGFTERSEYKANRADEWPNMFVYMTVVVTGQVGWANLHNQLKPRAKRPSSRMNGRLFRQLSACAAMKLLPSFINCHTDQCHQIRDKESV